MKQAENFDCGCTIIDIQNNLQNIICNLAIVQQKTKKSQQKLQKPIVEHNLYAKHMYAKRIDSDASAIHILICSNAYSFITKSLRLEVRVAFCMYRRSVSLLSALVGNRLSKNVERVQSFGVVPVGAAAGNWPNASSNRIFSKIRTQSFDTYLPAHGC